jgi:hypothetical protein
LCFVGLLADKQQACQLLSSNIRDRCSQGLPSQLPPSGASIVCMAWPASCVLRFGSGQPGPWTTQAAVALALRSHRVPQCFPELALRLLVGLRKRGVACSSSRYSTTTPSKTKEATESCLIFSFPVCSMLIVVDLWRVDADCCTSVQVAGSIRS